LHTGVYEPEDEKEAADAAQHDADYCSGGGAVVDVAVGGGDYAAGGLADLEEGALAYCCERGGECGC